MVGCIFAREAGRGFFPLLAFLLLERTLLALDDRVKRTAASVYTLRFFFSFFIPSWGQTHGGGLGAGHILRRTKEKKRTTV